jgi:hypothetical protein
VIAKLNKQGKEVFSTPPMSDNNIATQNSKASLQVFEDNSFLFVGATSTKREEHFTLFRYDANGRLLWLKEHPIKLKESQRLEWLEFVRTKNGKFAAIVQVLDKQGETKTERGLLYKYKTEARLVIFSEQGDWEKDAILPTLTFTNPQHLSIERAHLFQTKEQNFFLCAWLGDGGEEHQIILQNIQLQ